MIQKLQFISRLLLLVCLPVFVLQPLLVSLVSSLPNSGAGSVQKASPTVKVHYIKEASAKRAEFHFSVLTPCIQKMILAFSTSRRLVFAADSIQHSPQGSLVLRI